MDDGGAEAPWGAEGGEALWHGAGGGHDACDTFVIETSRKAGAWLATTTLAAASSAIRPAPAAIRTAGGGGTRHGLEALRESVTRYREKIRMNPGNLGILVSGAVAVTSTE